MPNRWLEWRAAVDLACAGGARLWLTGTLPAVLGLQLLTRVANHVAPPLGYRDLVLVRTSQEELATFFLAGATVVVWSFSRIVEARAWGVRLGGTARGVVADFLTQLLAVAAGLLMWAFVSLDRMTLRFSLGSILTALAATAPVMALTPGLVRLRPSPGVLIAALLLLAAGSLGLLGSWFPVRADTVLAHSGSCKRWLADAAAGAGCLLISLGLAHRH